MRAGDEGVLVGVGEGVRDDVDLGTTGEGVGDVETIMGVLVGFGVLEGSIIDVGLGIGALDTGVFVGVRDGVCNGVGKIGDEVGDLEPTAGVLVGVGVDEGGGDCAGRGL